MTTSTIVLLLLALAIAAYGAYLARVINGDGYGSRRQPPESHHRDQFDHRNRPTALA